MENNDGIPCLLKEVDGVNYLLSDCADLINNHLKKGEKWEPLTLYLNNMLLEGVNNPVVIDVGANIGAYSVPVAKQIKALGGRVYAYEAQRMVYYQCCANIFINNLTNCYIHHLAIGDTEGEVEVPQLDIRTHQNLGALSLDAEIRVQQNMHHYAKDAVERVRLSRLDSLALPILHLMKIDVEGLEYEVINGAQDLLAASHFPPILFEMWTILKPGMAEKQQKVLNLLNNMGYEVDRMGELALAQHPSRKKVNIALKSGGVVVSRVMPDEDGH